MAQSKRRKRTASAKDRIATYQSKTPYPITCFLLKRVHKRGTGTLQLCPSSYRRFFEATWLQTSEKRTDQTFTRRDREFRKVCNEDQLGGHRY